MCDDANFVLTNTNVFWSRNTSSHEEIIREFKLEHLDKHAAKIGLVRVEIVPPGDDFRLPQEQWIFRTDQDELPDWYDAVEAEQRVRAVLQYWIAACVVLPGQILENVTAGRWAVVYGEVRGVGGNATIITLVHIDTTVLSDRAVIVDRSGDVPVCYVAASVK